MEDCKLPKQILKYRKTREDDLHAILRLLDVAMARQTCQTSDLTSLLSDDNDLMVIYILQNKYLKIITKSL
jgi:hypothetical protein